VARILGDISWFFFCFFFVLGVVLFGSFSFVKKESAASFAIFSSSFQALGLPRDTLLTFYRPIHRKIM